MESEEGLLVARGQGGLGRRAVAVALKRTEISGETGAVSSGVSWPLGSQYSGCDTVAL